MEYIFLKKESMALDGINITHFKVGDKIEEKTVNNVSRTLLAYYLKHKILGTKSDIIQEDIAEVIEILDDKEVTIEENKIIVDASDILGGVNGIEEVNESDIPEDATIIDEVEIQENSEEDMEVKSCNPVMDNKAITNLDNKSLEDLSINELKAMLFKKGINFDKRIGKEKLIKLLEENE